jgi:calcium-independent phospholipase A2-gamma
VGGGVALEAGAWMVRTGGAHTARTTRQALQRLLNDAQTAVEEARAAQHSVRASDDAAHHAVPPSLAHAPIHAPSRGPTPAPVQGAPSWRALRESLSGVLRELDTLADAEHYVGEARVRRGGHGTFAAGLADTLQLHSDAAASLAARGSHLTPATSAARVESAAAPVGSATGLTSPLAQPRDDTAGDAPVPGARGSGGSGGGGGSGGEAGEAGEGDSTASIPTPAHLELLRERLRDEQQAHAVAQQLTRGSLRRQGSFRLRAGGSGAPSPAGGGGASGAGGFAFDPLSAGGGVDAGRDASPVPQLSLASSSADSASDALAPSTADPTPSRFTFGSPVGAGNGDDSERPSDSGDPLDVPIGMRTVRPASGGGHGDLPDGGETVVLAAQRGTAPGARPSPAAAAQPLADTGASAQAGGLPTGGIAGAARAAVASVAADAPAAPPHGHTHSHRSPVPAPSLAAPLAAAAAAAAASAASPSAPPPPPARVRGLRILSLDGGGIRGLLIIETLRRLEAQTGRRIADLFDLVCGTSTGGFIALAIAQRKQLDDVAAEYEALRTAFGAQSALMTEVKRFAVGSAHSTTVAEESCRRFFGRLRMCELPPSPKVFVVCAAVDAVPPQPYLFRSYELTAEAFAESEFLGTANVFTHEAARATTAAPTIYSPAVIGGARLVDGAILANNPVLAALSEAALLWPGAPIDVLASVGTGTQMPRPFPATAGVVAWGKVIVDTCLNPFVAHKVAATLLGPGGGYAAANGGLAPYYCRLDVEGGGDVDISETRVEVLERMLQDGRRYIERQTERFAELAAALGY